MAGPGAQGAGRSRAGGGGLADARVPRALWAGRVPHTLGAGFGPALRGAHPLLCTHPIPLFPPFLPLPPTPNRYRELFGNRWDFSGCGVHCLYPNKSSSLPAGGRRLPVLLSADAPACNATQGGLPCSPGGRWGGGLPGRLDDQPPRAEGPLAAPLCLAAPTDCGCSGNPPGRARPQRKLKANLPAEEARTFLDASLQRRLGGGSGLSAKRARGSLQSARGSLQSAGPGIGNAREGASPLFLANTVAKVPRTDVEAVLAGIAPGRSYMAFSKLQKELSEKRRRPAWDPLALPRAKWSEVLLGREGERRHM